MHHNIFLIHNTIIWLYYYLHLVFINDISFICTLINISLCWIMNYTFPFKLCFLCWLDLTKMIMSFRKEYDTFLIYTNRNIYMYVYTKRLWHTIYLHIHIYIWYKYNIMGIYYKEKVLYCIHKSFYTYIHSFIIYIEKHTFLFLLFFFYFDFVTFYIFLRVNRCLYVYTNTYIYNRL